MGSPGGKVMFAFPSFCLAQPSELAKSCGILTIAVVKQTQLFKEEGVVALSRIGLLSQGEVHTSVPLSPLMLPQRREQQPSWNAIRLLCSTDTMAEASPATFQQLLSKHPPATGDRREPESTPWEPLQRLQRYQVLSPGFYRGS